MNLLLVYFEVVPVNAEEARRFENAHISWRPHYLRDALALLPEPLGMFLRSSGDLNDPRPVPYVHDVFDYGCHFSAPDDIVIYINRDIGLTIRAPELIRESVQRNGGATVAFRRSLIPEPGKYYDDLSAHILDGGFDLMAFTPKWWADNRSKMPDMVIGREAWDNCFCCLLDEPVHGRLFPATDGIQNNPLYLDNVIWHEPHKPYWVQERLTNPGNLLNRKLAIEFFTERGNEDMLALLKAG